MVVMTEVDMVNIVSAGAGVVDLTVEGHTTTTLEVDDNLKRMRFE